MCVYSHQRECIYALAVINLCTRLELHAEQNISIQYCIEYAALYRALFDAHLIVTAQS
jgi:hypothetical protein